MYQHARFIKKNFFETDQVRGINKDFQKVAGLFLYSIQIKGSDEKHFLAVIDWVH